MEWIRYLDCICKFWTLRLDWTVQWQTLWYAIQNQCWRRNRWYIRRSPFCSTPAASLGESLAIWPSSLVATSYT